MAGSFEDRIDPALIERFARDLDALAPADPRLGLAVSGGPDSVAMLLLAAADRHSLVEAATVDHALRPESRQEAEFVALLCQSLGVRHSILTVEWREKPRSALQERARAQRYALLSQWAADRGLDAVLTAHHRDDQAETFLMRLARGAGVAGLAAMRPVSRVPGSGIPLVRPLLHWSHAELASVCTEAGITAVNDASNSDEQYERVRVRKALADASWLDPEPIAASAAHLAEADEALDWATTAEWERATGASGATITYRPTEAPGEVRRRIVARAIAALAGEGEANPLRGAEISRVLAALNDGSTVTLRGVLCSGGVEWRFSKAPERRA